MDFTAMNFVVWTELQKSKCTVGVQNQYHGVAVHGNVHSAVERWGAGGAVIKRFAPGEESSLGLM